MTRRQTLAILIAVIAIAFCALLASASVTGSESATKRVYPGATWQQVETPEAIGWSSDKLDEAQAFAERLNSAAVMIVHRGMVVESWGDVERNYLCHSMRKSLLSAL